MSEKSGNDEVRRESVSGGQARCGFLLLWLGPDFDVRPIDDDGDRVLISLHGEGPLGILDSRKKQLEVLLVISGPEDEPLPPELIVPGLAHGANEMFPPFRERGWSVEPLDSFLAAGKLAWVARIGSEGLDLPSELRWVATQDCMVSAGDEEDR